MGTILLLALGLLLFIGLVVAHELGHFMVARRNGVEAEEFGIGFPPRFWKRRIKSKRGDFDFTLNALPLGGFVKLKGEHDEDSGPGSFGAANLKVKAKIMLAGVAVNLLIAILLFTFIALVGMPKLITKDSGSSLINEEQFSIRSDEHPVKRQLLVAQVSKDAPADKAGLRALDELVAIGEKGGALTPVGNMSVFPSQTKALAGKTVTIQFKRDGVVQQTTTQLLSDAEVAASKNAQGVPTKGYLGISPSAYEVNRYTWSAPIVAVGLTGQITKLTFQALGDALVGLGRTIAGIATFNTAQRSDGQAQASEQVSGPLGIFFVLKAGAQQGVVMVLFIIALISLTLAIMNVLPIPALDGGRLFLLLGFRLFRKPLSQKVEETVVGASFAVLMVLFLLITVVDVKRFF